ncbi:MAG: hypothetical protein LBC12_00380 [Nitrososphaerota archaeon]|jgi:hypothetical protein|nr:hypothetical protein [Nitrososphaerota archaeon]
MMVDNSGEEKKAAQIAEIRQYLIHAGIIKPTHNNANSSNSSRPVDDKK